MDVLYDPALWTVLIFLFLLLIKVPIAISIGIASLAVAWQCDLGLPMTSYNFFANIAKFPLLAIPYFILAGNIMSRAGIATRIINLIRISFGKLTGGLAIATVIVAAFWGAVSGSPAATVAALGVILIPGMVDAGYSRPFATAVVSVSSGLSSVIPPSIAFIMYGVITGVSIGAIFAAGFIPGFIIAFCMIVSVYLSSRRHGYRGDNIERKPGDLRAAFKEAIFALLIPVIILGGIYGGIFTPTEAAAVACFYGLFVGVFVYRSLTIKVIYEVLVDTLIGSAIVMFISACAGLYSWVSASVGLVEKTSALLIGISGNEYVTLLMIYIILFIGGMLLDAVSLMYVFMPLIMPVMANFGWDPVWFGVMLAIMVAIGCVTPPVAVSLFVGCRISGLTIEELTPPVLPLLFSMLCGMAVLSIFPQITMFLPKLMGFM
ncbi:TRAP transporter large permease [Cloacibacillus porcorum]|uniref:C4-dicarboxylate ABC transporter permease n=1 Tax=Cloacibacillus porcorum TaxID=1197717 RepID=A0A1B2I171_9BACT|nr:TRAP transporter large permease [Cloacibacillus porcorum]ANZ43721.1 C4-dicarboxylate ABC transporter permease [Cloacibacillus porcorum]MCC8185367.1 TRAP transporter large permease [Cloacibacillus porcorum]MCI5863842.1 TRAP transporter large permease [Cloacibacillus porcorum]MDD7648625.1 TRAP transporter large permease [Cloacibacillus porcorum]MDY4094257.1 TRAP transporter large permease [Cloacibacillus porcorum]